MVTSSRKRYTRSESADPTAREAGETSIAPYEASDDILAILGGATRKGSWEPAARLRVLALMGGVELDFREADLLEGETEVEVLALMGGVTIVVPPDVDVQSNGLGLLGGFGSVSNATGDPDAPRLRISGSAIMGGVDVKVKKLPRRILG